MTQSSRGTAQIKVNGAELVRWVSADLTETNLRELRAAIDEGRWAILRGDQGFGHGQERPAASAFRIPAGAMIEVVPGGIITEQELYAFAHPHS